MTAGTVLVTGSAGAVGSALVPRLAAAGWALRLVDRVPGSGFAVEPPHTETVGDCFDDAVLDAVLPGCDAVVHLAAVAGEAPVEEIAASHIVGTARVLEAARRNGVRRVVAASSNHAVGFTPRADLVGVDVRPRPDSFYGMGKVATEALCSLYADRYGMQTACLRIGTSIPRPLTRRHLSTWLSPDDLGRLVDACLRAPDLTYAVVYGISANTRRWWDLDPGRALGYDPQDDAEAYAAEILASTPEQTPDDDEYRFLGGSFAHVDGWHDPRPTPPEVER
ncbi:MAG: NAD(P)-dependent oxidoreductase [Candidatus Nanopelagicales bacterium]